MAPAAEKYKHVLIIRLSAMGDVVMCVPVVEQLRKAYPGLRISVLTREKFRVFFRDIPSIEFPQADFNGHHKGLTGLYRLYRELMDAGVDAVADLHDVLRTKLLRWMLRLSGKHTARIHKGRADKSALTRKFRKIKIQLKTSVERYRDTLARLGLPTAHPVPHVRNPLPLAKAVTALTGKKEGVWIGVAPFSLHKGKVYPTIHTDSLIGLLAERYDRVLIFGGGPHEKDFADYMQQRYPKVTSLIGQVSLAEEIDVISNLDCMVCMDSAAMHMASLTGIPAVSVWGATHPYAGFYGFGQNPEDAVQLDLPCRPCSVYGNRPCLYRDYRCLNQIPPTTILEHVARAIARNKE